MSRLEDQDVETLPEIVQSVEVLDERIGYGLWHLQAGDGI
jgi:hypothetical protein